MSQAVQLDLEGSFLDLRRHPRVRVDAPFACALSRRGIKSWWSQEDHGLGVVFDVSIGGAKLMTESPIKAGERMTLTLNLPKQAAPMKVDVAAVRWVAGQTAGIEFLSFTQEAEWRLRKYLSQVVKPATARPHASKQAPRP